MYHHNIKKIVFVVHFDIAWDSQNFQVLRLSKPKFGIYFDNQRIGYVSLWRYGNIPNLLAEFQLLRYSVLLCCWDIALQKFEAHLQLYPNICMADEGNLPIWNLCFVVFFSGWLYEFIGIAVKTIFFLQSIWIDRFKNNYKVISFPNITLVLTRNRQWPDFNIQITPVFMMDTKLT